MPRVFQNSQSVVLIVVQPFFGSTDSGYEHHFPFLALEFRDASGFDVPEKKFNKI
jgi:hypothetical protein